MATKIKDLLKPSKELDYLDYFQINKYGFDIVLVKKGVELTTNLIEHLHYLVNVKQTAIDTEDQIEKTINVIYFIPKEKRKDIGVILHSLDTNKLQTKESKQMFEDLKIFHFKKYEHLELLIEDLFVDLMNYNKDIDILLQPVWNLFQKLPNNMKLVDDIDKVRGVVEFRPKYCIKWKGSKEQLEYLFQIWIECELIEKVIDINPYLANFVDDKNEKFVNDSPKQIKLHSHTAKTELFYFVQQISIKDLIVDKRVNQSLEYSFVTFEGEPCHGYRVQSYQSFPVNKADLLQPFINKVANFKQK